MRLVLVVLAASLLALVAFSSVDEREGALLTAVVNGEPESSSSTWRGGAPAGQSSDSSDSDAPQDGDSPHGGDTPQDGVLIGGVSDSDRSAGLIDGVEVVGSHDLEVADVDPGERAAPVRLRIDAMNLDAPIISVGVTSTGDFDVPQKDTVGWYRYGSLPGASGSAVLAAHVDYGHQPGAFRQLHRLVEGDEFEIDLDDGSTIRLVVAEQALYNKSALPASDLFAQTGPPIVRLVTCGGAYDPSHRTYSGNRVVTAYVVEV